MDILKEAQVGGNSVPGEEELALINSFAQKTLTAEEVFTFGVKLCDNEVDRDGERFSEETLAGLAELFVGKSGIFDHRWSALGQSARIYRTELIKEDGAPTAAGKGYVYLKGWAYMLRTDENRGLIAEIEGGIKKEVSVGCSVEKAVCSICGEDAGSCGHRKGERYDGRLCWTELTGAADAYEWSFVAVPAQKKAGVMKAMRQEDDTLKQLEQEAELGRRYLKSLRGEVARAGGLAGQGEMAVLERALEKLDEEELLELKKRFEGKKEVWSGKAQLSYGGSAVEPEIDGAFVI